MKNTAARIIRYLQKEGVPKGFDEIRYYLEESDFITGICLGHLQAKGFVTDQKPGGWSLTEKGKKLEL